MGSVRISCRHTGLYEYAGALQFRSAERRRLGLVCVDCEIKSFGVGIKSFKRFILSDSLITSSI